MAQLQKNAAKAEIYLKDRYELEVIQALADKFKASEQKSRLRKFDSTMWFISLQFKEEFIIWFQLNNYPFENEYQS